MASFCAMLTRSRLCRSLFASFRSSQARHTQKKSAIKWFASASALLAHCQTRDFVNLQTAEVSKLRQENLLKGAADQNVDAVAIMLSQTTQAVLQAEDNYRQTLTRLMGLLEHHLTVLGKKEEEERVWDVILQGRDRLQVCHKQVQELQLLFTFVEKMTAASAEVAYLAGSESSALSLEEQLSSAQEQLKTAQEQRLHLDLQLQKLQARCVENFTR